MAKLEFVLALTALFACQFSQSNAGISSKNWPYPPNQWSLISDLSNHERRAYLACEGRKGRFSKSQGCIVGYHKLTHSTVDNTCNVLLRVKQTEEEAYIGENPTMFLFGKDKSVIVWRELGPKTYLRINIIESSSCKISSARLVVAFGTENFRDDFRFAVGNQSFDMFFKNDTCGDKICWMTRSDKAKKINGPIGYIKTKDNYLPSFVQRIEEDAPEKGHFMSVPTKNGGFDFFLTKPDGTSKLLAQTKKSGYLVSLKNNLVGICYRTETGSKCAQYDFNGKMKLEVNMDMPESIYNLANGGFLSTSEHKGKCNGYDCLKSFSVTKTDNNGANIGNLKCSGALYYRKMYENEEGKYCLSEPCERKTPAGSSTIDCFDDSIFSK